MSDSSPSDLAVAFRSFGRRIRQAIELADDDPARVSATAPHAAKLQSLVQQAGRLIGGGFGTSVDQVGPAVADRIAAIKPDDWDEHVLQQLRELAAAAGAEIRAAERAAQA